MARKGAAIWSAINTGWPADMKRPTDEEALRGARMIYGRFMKRPWTGPMRVARGRSRTWVRWDGRPYRPKQWTLVVGPEYHYPRPGWPAIVHDLSHYVHSQRSGERPHSIWQAWLEREMQLFVIEQVLR